MPNDNERREVARRLRELEKCAIGALIPTGELAENILRAIDYGYSGAMTPYGRLADLIEPSGHGCVPGECPLNVRHDNDRINRDTLLEEVKELEKCAYYFGLDFDEDEPLRDRLKEASEDFAGSARRIREALGVQDA